MNGYDVLARGRALAEDAEPFKLKSLVGDLLAMGRVADGEYYVIRVINVSKPIEECDGLYINRFVHVTDALALALGGWLLGRVAHGSRLTSAVVGDADLAVARLTEMGLDWTRSP